ncbi:DNRLRE domain-containing protein [Streptomyces tanashiensis]
MSCPAPRSWSTTGTWATTLQAQVKTPINSDYGNKRTDYVLNWDVLDKTAGTWPRSPAAYPACSRTSRSKTPPPTPLGLEKFYAYSGKNTGAGAR